MTATAVRQLCMCMPAFVGVDAVLGFYAVLNASEHLSVLLSYGSGCCSVAPRVVQCVWN